MERRPSSQPNHPGVEHETYAEVTRTDMGKLRRDTLISLSGNKITEEALEEDLRKIAIKEKDKDLERFKLSGEVELERMLFLSGSMTELYKSETHTYRISYNEGDHVAEVTKRTRESQAQMPTRRTEPESKSFIKP